MWFDPERHYEDVARSLKAGQERVVAFQGSYYQLRREVEPFVRGLEPPKLLVYLPVAWEEAQEPLAELLALGLDLRPGVAGNRNTRLAVIARKALKGRVPDARLADLDRQIEQGGLTLHELEQLAEEGVGGPLPTTLAVLFGTGLVEEAALEFLGNPQRDQELTERNGLADWARSLGAAFGLPAEAGGSAAELRFALARQALTSELVEVLGEEVPDALARLVSQGDPAARKRGAELARAWRNRRDLSSSYPELAAAVEKSLHLDSIDFRDAALERIEAFPGLERGLLRRVAEGVRQNRAAAVVAESRQRGFWAGHDTELQAEWALVAQAGQLLRRAAEIEAESRARRFTWPELVENHTGPKNWAELDTLQRRLERRASSLEYSLATPAPEVEQLVTVARQRYREVAGGLAEQFLRAWRDGGFAIAGYARQTEVFDRFVAPELNQRRTVYILVDALRWELARELPEVLGGAFETHTELVIGTAPSITEVGMAALLPSAASGLELGGASKLEVRLHGRTLKNRADRMAYLKEKAGVPVVDLRLEDPRGFRRRLKDLGDGPALVVVTSREIDQSGEEELSSAREQMERVLTHLGLAMRRLAEEGFERFVIATDHGYVHGEALAESDKIDPPGGEALLCHRRTWIGRGATSGGECLLTEVNRFGAASELLMAVPWNLAAFRTAGPTAYFHGGLSPQEILLPVIVASPTAVAKGKGARRLTWEIALGTARVTARFLSVRIQARSGGLLDEAWPLVRVEVRAGGEVCAVPVSATYGYQEATGAVALRSSEANPAETEANTVALMLTGKAPSRGVVSVHVVDVATGVELKKLESVEVSLAI
ncbi:MAG: PglZ domain-containing protein [Vicinamibacterales bacterium]